jgi:uncharacterized protein YdeI (YjbR/CyaY-like superfamily)
MLNFVKGALLKDRNGILVKPGENTQAGRWPAPQKLIHVL